MNSKEWSEWVMFSFNTLWSSVKAQYSFDRKISDHLIRIKL